MSKMERFVVRATAKSIRRRSVLLKVSSVIVAMSVSLLLGFYGFFAFADDLGNFSIGIEQTNYERGISLSNTRDFASPTVYISADAVEGMNNITESWLPKDIDSVDGPHNGENYIAHTFYIKNVGDIEISYLAEIKILEARKEADEAIRVKIYKDGESVTYAKKQKGLEIPEPNTTPFYSIDKVMSQTVQNFKVDEIHKYTVVIWLEGNDPECIDNIIGGRVNMEMNFKIVDEEVQNL